MSRRFVKINSGPKSKGASSLSKEAKQALKNYTLLPPKKRQVRVELKPKKRLVKVEQKSSKCREKKEEEVKLPNVSELKSCSREWHSKRLEVVDDSIPYPNEKCRFVKSIQVEYRWELVNKPEPSKLSSADIDEVHSKEADFEPDAPGLFQFVLHTSVGGEKYEDSICRFVVRNDRSDTNQKPYVWSNPPAKLIEEVVIASSQKKGEN